MFEVAELGRKLSKKEYGEQVPELRTRLLAVQRELSQAGFPVLIIINGLDGAGKGETVNKLHEWFDARHLLMRPFGDPVDEELQRPLYWRYWMALPANGKIGIFSGAYYERAIRLRVFDKAHDSPFEAALERAAAFEQSLVDSGTLIVKFWLHIGKKQQRKRFKKLEKDEGTRWRVTKRDWEKHDLYDAFHEAAERCVRKTSTGEAPWTIVESVDWRFRNVTIARTLTEAIERRLAQQPRKSSREPMPAMESPPATILDTLDLTKRLSKKQYGDRLEHVQGRLNRLARKAYKKDLGVIMVFEGWDAAGKGGAIRRVLQAIDARQYQVIPISAPTDEEKAHHYLWRFWRQLSRMGRFTIYDRSWYGRVLVERVEGFAAEDEWMRAYKEINDFEEQLVEHGILLLKFWLHISPEEQLRRFQEREKIPWKKHKITEEDYRNREKTPQYLVAVNDMIGRTSTEFAPWTLVEGESKLVGRIRVLETVADGMEERLG